MLVDSIKGFTPLGNNILVSIDKRFSDEILLDGPNGKLVLRLDCSFDPEMHSRTFGTVSAVPAQFKRKQGDDWYSDLEVSVGDKVFFSFNAVSVAFGKTGNPLIVREGPEKGLYINIPYSQLTAKIKEDGSPQMLNGFCLIEPVAAEDLPVGIQPKEVKSKIILAPKATKRRPLSIGRVHSVGSPVVYVNSRSYFDDENVKPGQLVAFDPFSNVSIQYELHASLVGKKAFYKIQRRWLQAVIEIE